MIGFLLLFVSIILYIKGNKKWSYLLFVSFCSGGFYLLTDNVMGLKNQDAALLYFVVILLYSHIREKNVRYVHNRELERWLLLFFIFMILNVLFSFTFYELNLIQIIQGGRRYFIIFSFLFIRKIKAEDVEWVLRKIIYITAISSVLYIIQCQTGLPVLPDSEFYYSDDCVDGTFRYYNAPPFLDISLFLLVFYPKYFKGWKNIAVVATMFVALLCTQGRTQIAGTITVLLWGLYLHGSYRKITKYILLGSMAVMLLMPIVMERFESNDKSTGGDLSAIMAGEFIDANAMYSGTMTFRFALVYERIEYLTDKSIGEQIFGMGLLSDQQKQLVNKMYNFKIGLRDKETGGVVQLSTPDIAYGNLICRLGFLGMFIFIMVWLIMLVQAYKYRKLHAIALCSFLYLFNFFVVSFAGATISYAENIIVPMMLTAYMNKMVTIANTNKYERKSKSFSDNRCLQ